MHSTLEMSEGEDPEKCFRSFNPHTKELYDDSVANWAAAYVETLNLVAKHLQNADRAPGTVNAHNHV